MICPQIPTLLLLCYTTYIVTCTYSCHILLVQVPVPWTLPLWFHEWWWQHHKISKFVPILWQDVFKLTSHISSGYRDFASILQHRSCSCLNHPTNSLPGLNHARGCNNTIPGPMVALDVGNSLPNFPINPQLQPSLDACPQDVWKTCCNHIH